MTTGIQLDLPFAVASAPAPLAVHPLQAWLTAQIEAGRWAENPGQDLDPRRYDPVAWNAQERLRAAGAPIGPLDLSGLEFSRLQAQGLYAPGLNMQGFAFGDSDGHYYSGLIRKSDPVINLSKAVLNGANFDNAILFDEKGPRSGKGKTPLVSLARADLCGASFRNADLRGVDLTDAIIDAKTDFTGAQLDGARTKGMALQAHHLAQMASRPSFLQVPGELAQLCRARDGSAPARRRT